jgi:membrane associated rhomboid family serine protease
MFPLNDTEPNRYSFLPIMTIILIVVNCLVFVFELFSMSQNSSGFWTILMKYAVTPKLILSVQGGGALSNVTAMFMHGGFLHLFGNMLALWVFGRRVEDACGSVRFLAFYLLAGTMAHVLFVAVQHNSDVPGIGASGAIFGLMGAYLVLYPGGRIRTLIIWFIPLWPRIRAIWIVLYFVGIQIVPAFRILTEDAEYSVNHWAHLGGFFSAVFILLFLRPEAYARYLSDTPV